MNGRIMWRMMHSGWLEIQLLGYFVISKKRELYPMMGCRKDEGMTEQFGNR